MDTGTNYKVRGIQYDEKFNIVGFKIESTIDQKVVNIDTLGKLINNGEVIGQDIIEDDNGTKHILCQDQSLGDLEMVYGESKHGKNELTAVAVLLKDNQPYGYRFKSGDNFLNYSLNVTWELARRGCIQNMKAGFEGDQKQICGTNGLNIWELNTIHKT